MDARPALCYTEKIYGLSLCKIGTHTRRFQQETVPAFYDTHLVTDTREYEVFCDVRNGSC